MLNVKKILLLVVAFAFVAIDAAFSQSNVKIDSLTALLNKYPKEDTVKARLLIELGEVFYDNADFEKAKKNFEQALALSEQIGDIKAKMTALNGVGLAYTGLKDIKQAIPYYEQSIVLAQKLNDRQAEGRSLGDLGLAYSLSNNLSSAIEYLKKAIIINERINNHSYSLSDYSNLGDVYMKLRENNQAADSYNKALTIAEKLGKKSSAATLVRKIGIATRNIELLEKEVAQNEKESDWNTAMNNYMALAQISDVTFNFTKSLGYYGKALAIAIKTKDKLTEVRCYSYIGVGHYQLQNYIEAIAYFQKALVLNETVNFDLVTQNTHTQLIELYLALSDNDKALEYCNKAITAAKRIKNERFEAFVYGQMSVCYKRQKKYDEALKAIERSSELHKRMGNTVHINFNLGNLGNIYNDMGRKLDAHRCYQEELDYYKKTIDIHKDRVAAVLLNLASLYAEVSDSLVLQMGINPSERYEKAVKFATEGLEISSKLSLNDKVPALRVLSNTYEKKGDYTKAYDIYKQYMILKDSLSGDNVKKQITRKEIQFEFDKKETELKYQQQLTQGELEKQRLLTAQQEQDLLLNRQNLMLKEQALALSNREKDLAHLAYLKEQAEKQEKAQQLSLSEEREKGKERDLSLKNLELSAQQKQNLYLGLLAAVLLGGLGTLFYFYNTLKKQKNIIAQQNELNEHTIAILSHDIKEPLLGVKLMLKKLNKDDPFVAQASQSLEGQINSVNGILTNLLKMKKLSLTKKDKNVQADVQAVVKNVLQELNVAIQSKELTVENDITEGVKLPIAPEKLQIIVHNLLSNAVKYSFPNQKIRIFNEGKGFCIQDFGVGLSPEQRSKLMREVTASQRGTNQEKGNGLGLFLIGAMLQGENIKVVFDSPEVGGTIVKVLG